MPKLLLILLLLEEEEGGAEVLVRVAVVAHRPVDLHKDGKITQRQSPRTYYLAGEGAQRGVSMSVFYLV